MASAFRVRAYALPLVRVPAGLATLGGEAALVLTNYPVWARAG